MTQWTCIASVLIAFANAIINVDVALCFANIDAFGISSKIRDGCGHNGCKSDERNCKLSIIYVDDDLFDIILNDDNVVNADVVFAVSRKHNNTAAISGHIAGSNENALILFAASVNVAQLHVVVCVFISASDTTLLPMKSTIVVYVR